MPNVPSKNQRIATLFVNNVPVHTGVVEFCSPLGVTFVDGFSRRVDFSRPGNRFVLVGAHVTVRQLVSDSSGSWYRVEHPGVYEGVSNIRNDDGSLLLRVRIDGDDSASLVHDSQVLDLLPAVASDVADVAS